MALQAGFSRDNDKYRFFNPDRDVVWLFPRIAERVLKTKFSSDLDEMRTAAAARKIELPADDAELVDICTQFDGLLARTINKMGAPDNSIAERKEAVLEFFKDSRIEPIRALYLVLLSEELFSELPLWLAQVRGQANVASAPSLEDIATAANELTERLANRGA